MDPKPWHKKSIERKDLIIIGFFGFLIYGVTLVAEKLTITSYYPSPYGVYKELHSTGNTLLATQSGSNVGIGTTSPSSGYALDVNGNLTATGIIETPNLDLYPNSPTPEEGRIDYDSGTKKPYYHDGTNWTAFDAPITMSNIYLPDVVACQDPVSGPLTFTPTASGQILIMAQGRMTGPCGNNAGCYGRILRLWAPTEAARIDTTLCCGWQPYTIITPVPINVTANTPYNISVSLAGSYYSQLIENKTLILFFP
ncbi:hypothetical protein ACFL6Y_01635 [Elusimicrobiota bacterium]